MGRSVELAPWMKWLVGCCALVAVAILAISIAILVIVAKNDGKHCSKHHHHSDSSESEDDIDTLCTEKFLKDLLGSKWVGNTTILTKDGILVGRDSIEFPTVAPGKHKQRLPKGAFYVINRYKSFDPKTWKLLVSGIGEFAGFVDIFPDGACVLRMPELQPEADSFAQIRFLSKDDVEFKIQESSDKSLSIALRGELKRVHYH